MKISFTEKAQNPELLLKQTSWGSKNYLSYQETSRDHYNIDVLTLNIFQRALRFIFGIYKNTHLKNVTLLMRGHVPLTVKAYQIAIDHFKKLSGCTKAIEQQNKRSTKSLRELIWAYRNYLVIGHKLSPKEETRLKEECQVYLSYVQEDIGVSLEDLHAIYDSITRAMGDEDLNSQLKDILGPFLASLRDPYFEKLLTEPKTSLRYNNLALSSPKNLNWFAVRWSQIGESVQRELISSLSSKFTGDLVFYNLRKKTKVDLESLRKKAKDCLKGLYALSPLIMESLFNYITVEGLMLPSFGLEGEKLQNAVETVKVQIPTEETIIHDYLDFALLCSGFERAVRALEDPISFTQGVRTETAFLQEFSNLWPKPLPLNRADFSRMIENWPDRFRKFATFCFNPLFDHYQEVRDSYLAGKEPPQSSLSRNDGLWAKPKEYWQAAYQEFETEEVNRPPEPTRQHAPPKTENREPGPRRTEKPKQTPKPLSFSQEFQRLTGIDPGDQNRDSLFRKWALKNHPDSVKRRREATEDDVKMATAIFQKASDLFDRIKR